MKQQITAPTALALGNFDGLHRGHALVLQGAKQMAQQVGLVPGVLLFDEHPKQVLCGKAPPLLMTGEEKKARLETAGFRVLTLSFGSVKDLPPEAFADLLRTQFHAKAVCCGKNYRFGKDAAGTAETLQALCDSRGITVQIVDDARYKGELISSSRIRRAIENGNMEDANAMLLHPFSYTLPVVSGDKRGRTLGFPTANQFFLPQMIRPRAGVYASKVHLNGVWYPAVTNIGVRPTIGTETFRSETCILGFSGDLYGKLLTVFPLHYLRQEQKFKDLAALRTAMEADAAAAKEVLIHDERSGEAAGQSSLL